MGSQTSHHLTLRPDDQTMAPQATSEGLSVVSSAGVSWGVDPLRTPLLRVPWEEQAAPQLQTGFLSQEPRGKAGAQRVLCWLKPDSAHIPAPVEHQDGGPDGTMCKRKDKC